MLGCVYIPPNQPSSTYSNLCLSVDEIVGFGSASGKMLLMGDFNLPNTDWNVSTNGANDSSRYILDLAASHELKQYNGVTNYRGVTLDLVFSSIPDTEVVSTLDLLLPEDRHHPALDITISVFSSQPSHSPKLIPDYRRCDITEVFRQVQTMALPTPCDLLKIDEAFSTFSVHLSHLISQNTPKKKITASSFPKWFSKELQSLIIRKKIAHKQYKITGNHIYLELFRSLRTECKVLASSCHRGYITKVEESIPYNMKSFWTHVSNLKCSSAIPPTMTLDDLEAHDPAGKCDLFARHFSSVFSQSDIVIPSFNYGWCTSLNRIEVSATEVQSKLESLDPNKSAGPDAIPPIILKFCAPVLAVHLTVLFNTLLASGVYPSALKLGFVVPIHKSGVLSSIKNYRPIIIQSSLAKVFESLVIDQLYFHLRPFISERQHGFLRGRSTMTNLLVFQEYVMSAFVNSCQVDCIYLDYSKAFDKVHHGLLTAKLAGYGVGGRILEWLKSYLLNRKLLIKYDGAVSEPFLVMSGVPQGSHLGPLLFNVFINDITRIITTEHLMFADDLKIYAKVLSTSDQVNVQQALMKISRWCMENAMELNTLKCQVISYTRMPVTYNFDYNVGGGTLPRVTQVKDLGVLFTSSLSPLDHISSITSRANSLLGFIRRSTVNFRCPQSLLILYKSLVRSVLDYGSVIWSPYQAGHISMLDRIQIRFIRLLGVRLGHAYFETPISDVELQFNLQPLSLRRAIADLVFLFKLVNGVLDCSELLQGIDFVVPRGTRSSSTFCRRFQPTSYSYNSGLARLQRTGSEVAAEIDFFFESLSSFRRKVTLVSGS